ncbi:MAG: helix-turn-helix transcriptional regulator [Verrucomicrobiaceae bacterium]|nr:MAG: helix-turn-helix transcriptional regulator [Verrucomicrobiaceae bacterium]
MKEEFQLDEEDVRGIVRLISDTHVTPGDHMAKKRALMTGLAGIINADSWAWGAAYQMDPRKPSVHLSLIHGGFTDHTYAMVTQAYHHPGMSAFHAPFAKELMERRCHLTKIIGQFISVAEYKSSECYQLWLKADIEDVILSLRPVGEGIFSIIGLYRNPANEPFGLRENRIAHSVLSGVPWLNAEGWSEEQTITVRKLTPRQRMTMDLLIQGYTRAQIANRLEISIHTANEHVKAVYQYFEVHSQPELISRFRIGNGGDR